MKKTLAMQKRIVFDNGVRCLGFIPIEQDKDKIKAYHLNQILQVEVRGNVDPRSLKQLALYWVFCKKVAENTKFPTSKDVDEYVKLRCQYVDTFYNQQGQSKYRTKSISFEAMKQPDFNVFMDNSIPIMAEMLNVTEEALLNSQNDI